MKLWLFWSCPTSNCHQLEVGQLWNMQSDHFVKQGSKLPDLTRYFKITDLALIILLHYIILKYQFCFVGDVKSKHNISHDNGGSRKNVTWADQMNNNNNRNNGSESRIATYKYNPNRNDCMPTSTRCHENDTNSRNHLYNTTSTNSTPEGRLVDSNILYR